MPIVRITLIEGYDDATVATLAARVTAAVQGTLDAPADAVVVMADPVAPAHYFRGGTTRTPGPALPEASRVVHDYLAAMEARDLDSARGFLGEGFRMVFPGGHAFAAFEPLIAWSRTRYARVGKLFDGFDESYQGERTVVWCRGTLHGEWTDGSPFAGIRFVDRFELVRGRIMLQEVWNDLSDHRLAALLAAA
jgi:phenylpyruvate tautomerase PptA (4-oxalocrotonate tautomerase family)